MRKALLIPLAAALVGLPFLADAVHMQVGFEKAKKLTPDVDQAERDKRWADAVAILDKQLAILCQHDSWIRPTDTCRKTARAR